MLRIETGAATADKDRASAGEELSRERMAHIERMSDDDRTANEKAILDKAAVDGTWTQAAFELRESLLIDSELVKLKDGVLVVDGPKRAQKWNRKYISQVHNRIRANLEGRGAPEEAITAALAVTGSAMQEEGGPIAWFHRLLGLEQPYSASPYYDNPKKGPLSMTGGWERGQQPARYSPDSPTTPPGAAPTAPAAPIAARSGPLMPGPDARVITGGAGMTAQDWNSGATKGRAFFKSCSPANANGDGAGSERVRFPRPPDHRPQAARRLRAESHPTCRARSFAHGLRRRRVRPALSRGQYVTANIAEDITQLARGEGLKSWDAPILRGLTGKRKGNWENVLWGSREGAEKEQDGWFKTQNKVVRGATGFLANVLFDPLTYMTFGATSGARQTAHAAAEGAVRRAAGRGQRASKELAEGLGTGAQAREMSRTYNDAYRAALRDNSGKVKGDLVDELRSDRAVVESRLKGHRAQRHRARDAAEAHDQP